MRRLPERPKVCVVGACNVDMISYVPRLPRMGETLHGTGFRLGYGGKGANQAVMAAKLGAEVSMVGKVGADEFGRGAMASLAAVGVDISHVSVTEEAFTGVAPIMVDEQGNNSIVIVTGANDLLSVEDIQQAKQALSDSAVTVCQLEIPLETTEAALREAHAPGRLTVLNPAPVRADYSGELFGLVDVLCPNKNEAELLLDQPTDTIDAAIDAARALAARGKTSAVVTLGEQGCVVASDEFTGHLAGIATPAVDSTGAGDAFVGSLAYFLASGHPLPSAAARANHIAAISVRGHGTQTSFPNRSELPAELIRDG
jgi:ribokinase